MTTSVVIVCHQPGDWLARCLASVLDQADEVLVVDNGSIDGVASQAASKLGARSIRSAVNRGFAGGMNLGLSGVSGDVIALLNDDAVAGANWIETSRAALESAADVAAVVPKLLLAHPYAEIGFDDPPYYADGDPRPLGRCLHSITADGRDRLTGAVGPGLHAVETGRTEPTRWRWTSGSEPVYVPLSDGVSADVRCNGEPVEVRAVVDLVNNAGSYLSAEGFGGDYGYETPDRGAFDEARDCFAASGAAMVTTADMLHRVGPFAGSFFAYYEDTDWSWRAQLGGFRIRYEPGAVVRHLRGATTGGAANPRVQFFAARNRLLTLARNAPLPVFTTQLRAARRNPCWSPIRRSIVKRVPQGLAQRRRLARAWRRSPDDVWAQWAGMGERWPTSGGPIEAATALSGDTPAPPAQRDGR
ncbi:MAG TPA: glycosyltransferase family 2 protein [Acidimicrobiia bacterium]|nr:glycosyltransferase family 2 protein [Acidimicrobiia bacterium]